MAAPKGGRDWLVKLIVIAAGIGWLAIHFGKITGAF